ncbi:MAG: 50S ribosomal protein L21 [Leptolyngbyaceae cyanobacterium HOT.MB2.61]|jgi:large subunit ribosomal protein L21|nr:50S ribosomal protein L21 [Leptolyngbyaceae cyanobacterium HOT.MB2.61]
MTSYAIIEAGGKQLRVEPGRFYDINRIEAEPDSQITIDRVLFVQDDGTISIGQPLVEGATVEATVMRHLRGNKIIVYKMRPKKKTRKKQGHRQELTRLMINSINLGGAGSQNTAEAKTTTAKPAAEPEEAPVAEAEEPAEIPTRAEKSAPAGAPETAQTDEALASRPKAKQKAESLEEYPQE